ncbi:hypothetical protein B0A55_04726 [Friedmanniomyces simplex]|uniref:Ubiquitin carboxyl-terminal hydrolase n=1 Tax=Friedmanniomyces simplex TaxID=329884 RepID=A0A4U0XRY9_9PEZI|nr:hypothetical protein B0A55_04726 [Friedmanniomyces simplex]
MSQKRGSKRKATKPTPAAATNGDTGHTSKQTVPDRATWPGWVEMESEPAFFNVMLTEMGVQGVKVQEVYDMDEAFLLTLPQPIHALIFLFRYRETDGPQKAPDSCPKEVWFANQTPDFACATFALLNIVNNIPGLNLGPEPKKFRDFTQDMDPLSRGDAVDSFDFVKRIHNSFARDNDLLQADMHMKGKAGKFRKRQAIAKAKATKAAKKFEELAAPKTPPKEKSPNATQPTRSSARAKRPTPRKSLKESIPDDDPDDEDKAPSKIPAKATPEKLEQSNGLRRSKRDPKPRKPDIVSAAQHDPDDEEGFHFVAYMPIKGNVWRLDGLDRFPQVVGPFSEETGGWIQIARPHLVGRMEQYAASEIQFNLMAIVHDPFISERAALVENVRTLRAFGRKLDAMSDDWGEIDGAETKKDVILTESAEFGVTAKDLEALETTADKVWKTEEENDLLKLIQLRKEGVIQQAGLRAAVRDSLQATKDDEEKARHRRHGYGTFVRSWLGALAEQGVLSPLIED